MHVIPQTPQNEGFVTDGLYEMSCGALVLTENMYGYLKLVSVLMNLPLLLAASAVTRKRRSRADELPSNPSGELSAHGFVTRQSRIKSKDWDVLACPLSPILFSLDTKEWYLIFKCTPQGDRAF